MTSSRSSGFSNLRPKDLAHTRQLYINLVEKNQLPECYDPGEWESKDFHEAKAIQDFSIHITWCFADDDG
jgi:hypothetical protein